MLRPDAVLKSLQAYAPEVDSQIFDHAIRYIQDKFKDHKHSSGAPYVQHALELAQILVRLHLDVNAILAALLHETIVEGLVTRDELSKEFGADVADLVEGVAKISRMSLKGEGGRQAENFRKMLVALARDLRVILIKLADRLCNMRVIDKFPVDQSEPRARETLEIYAPLANRLGISWIKSELEDLAFCALLPEKCRELSIRVARRKQERKTYISEVQARLKRILKECQIDGEVTGRFKHLYSIYKKIERQKIDFDQVYDFIAFRVIVGNVRECYELLGMIHEAWRPIPGRFKDYIAMPKANGYQSLHTTVVGPGGERMEVQIRTRDMHEVAEGGIAAHWQYKERDKASDSVDKRFGWLRQLLEWQQDLRDSNDYLNLVKVDLFPDEVYVFTPGGDVKELPRDATPIDFAFAVHSDVGMHCTGARVNGRLVPLRTVLCNGDIIEIITSPSQHPSKDWLKFVRTSKARNKIRQFVKAEQRERSLELGRELLDKELRKHGSTLGRVLSSGEINNAVSELGYRETDDLLAAVGYGKVTPGQVVARTLPREHVPRTPGHIGRVVEKIRRKPSSAIKVQGVDDILVRFAKCCNPLPGDDVIGFITRGRGVTVHAADCPHVLDGDPERRIDVSWDADRQTTRIVRIKVYCADKKGMLASISSAITDAQANIVGANVVSTPEGGMNTFDLEVRDLNHLRKVFNAVQKVRGVERVERLRH